MTNQHPITPPSEIMDQWCMDFYELGSWRDIAIKAAQWGADQELKACCMWITREKSVLIAEELGIARRPKPPSLKEQALERCNDYIDPDGIIRRALEALPND